VQPQSVSWYARNFSYAAGEAVMHVRRHVVQTFPVQVAVSVDSFPWQ